MAQDSPLRKARKDRNLTLEQVVGDLDADASNGCSGVNAGMLSNWERGVHATTPRYRAILCDYYGQPSSVLFAHQDAQLSSVGEASRILAGHQDLVSALSGVVQRAKRYLVTTGSRSRDREYLKAIEGALSARPGLVHYRVLFGPPHKTVLRDHLMTLLELRDPADRSLGIKTLHIGMIEDTVANPERFICASEREAVLPIPSLTSAEEHDSGVLFGPKTAERWVDHVRQCYAGARRIETKGDLLALPLLRESKAAG